MSRKKGFSLVELLIVLAVMAALIATITPVALNAIKKSKATQVAQNLKTLASALENAAYVNGTVTSDPTKIRKSNADSAIGISDLGRDINDNYTFSYTTTGNGSFTATFTYSGGDVDAEIVNEILKEATGTTGGDITYEIVFTIY